MNPLVMPNWDDISQNVYAAILVGMAVSLWGLRRRISMSLQVMVQVFGVLPLSLVFIELLRSDLAYRWVSAGLLLIYLFGFFVQTVLLFRMRKDLERKSETLSRISGFGIVDAFPAHNVDNIDDVVSSSIGSFSMMGVGAEKVTRNFEGFRDMVLRCGARGRPVRMLLLQPGTPWLRTGAQKRGLGKYEFKDATISSLKRIARIKKEHKGEIEVRFYKTTPLFRIVFSGIDDCWLSYYSESVASQNINEFFSSTSRLIKIARLKDVSVDQGIYGFLSDYFDRVWEESAGREWNFQEHIN